MYRYSNKGSKFRAWVKSLGPVFKSDAGNKVFFESLSAERQKQLRPKLMAEFKKTDSSSREKEDVAVFERHLLGWESHIIEDLIGDEDGYVNEEDAVALKSVGREKRKMPVKDLLESFSFKPSETAPFEGLDDEMKELLEKEYKSYNPIEVFTNRDVLSRFTSDLSEKIERDLVRGYEKDVKRNTRGMEAIERELGEAYFGDKYTEAKMNGKDRSLPSIAIIQDLYNASGEEKGELLREFMGGEKDHEYWDMDKETFDKIKKLISVPDNVKKMQKQSEGLSNFSPSKDMLDRAKSSVKNTINETKKNEKEAKKNENIKKKEQRTKQLEENRAKNEAAKSLNKEKSEENIKKHQDSAKDILSRIQSAKDKDQLKELAGAFGQFKGGLSNSKGLTKMFEKDFDKIEKALKDKQEDLKPLNRAKNFVSGLFGAKNASDSSYAREISEAKIAGYYLGKRGFPFTRR